MKHLTNVLHARKRIQQIFSQLLQDLCILALTAPRNILHVSLLSDIVDNCEIKIFFSYFLINRKLKPRSSYTIGSDLFGDFFHFIKEMKDKGGILLH